MVSPDQLMRALGEYQALSYELNGAGITAADVGRDLKKLHRLVQAIEKEFGSVESFASALRSRQRQSS